MFRSQYTIIMLSIECIIINKKIIYTYTGVLINPQPDLLPFQLFFSVQGTGDSPTGPDPENRVGKQDTGSPGRPVSSGLQVPGEPFPSWSG
jgi:hypothetical protein